jgi:hypothetical protein
LRQRALVGGQGALVELGQAGRLHVGHGCFLLCKRTATPSLVIVLLSWQLAGSIEYIMDEASAMRYRNREPRSGAQ